MCAYFRIFVCEAKKEKAPIYRAQSYKEFWLYTSISPDKSNDSWEMPLMWHIPGRYETHWQ